MAASMENRSGRRGNPWRIAVWGTAAFLLLLPLVAMQFSKEVNWTLSDFVVFGVMLLVACGTYELARRLSGNIGCATLVVPDGVLRRNVAYSGRAVSESGAGANSHGRSAVGCSVLLPKAVSSPLVSLDSIYEWARSRGLVLDAEHVIIHGVPVQFLPAFNKLVEEAIGTARELTYEGVPVRVVDPEHLVALAIQAGGSRRRERAWQLLESGEVDRALLKPLLARHNLSFEIPDGI